MNMLRRRMMMGQSGEDYSKMYLTTKALESGTITFTRSGTGGVSYYSFDGTSWTSFSSTYTTPTLSAGDVVLWKVADATPSTMTSGIGSFSSTCNFEVYGNVMSMQSSDSFATSTTIQHDHQFHSLFKGCTKLLSAKNLVLAATNSNSKGSIYREMFSGCTALVDAPAIIPLSVMAPYACKEMFYNCTSLTTAPKLPAETVATYCYEMMFYYCASLTTAPELPATTLANYCYNAMFRGCNSLAYIKCLATNISATGCLGNWVYGVASTGTFVKAPRNNSWSRGASGIPTNWTVENDKSDYSLLPLTFKALESGVFSFARPNTTYQYLYYSLDAGLSWTQIPNGETDTPTIAAGKEICWYSGIGPVYNYGIGTFSATCDYEAYGNISSLKNYNDFSLNAYKEYDDRHFQKLFYNNTHLLNAKNVILTDEIDLTLYCYSHMFDGCSNLTDAPKLPATWVPAYCYEYMFANCTSLTEAPDLPAKYLTSNNCYQYMFYGCTNLNSIKCDIMDLSQTGCLLNWVDGVAASGTLSHPASATGWSSGVSGIPTGWTENKEGRDYTSMYLTFRALEDCTFAFSRNAIQYSLDGGETWTSLAAATSTPTIQQGSEICWKASGLTVATSYGIGTFSSTGNFEVFGNVMSMQNGDNFVGVTTLGANYQFARLFVSASKLISAEHLILPATTLKNYGYYYSFSGCSNMTKGPAGLPAQSISQSAYNNMFYNCGALIQAPEIRGTRAYSFSLSCMFENCTSLAIMPRILIDTVDSNCCYRMFYYCTNIEGKPKLTESDLAESCYEEMFALCSKLAYIQCVATDLSATNCLSDWVWGVASNGIFVYSSLAEGDWPTGDNGIPTGWTAYSTAET